MKDTIFMERDIRGKYPEDINEEIFEKIGNAFAQVVERDIVVACDGRIESPPLLNSFMEGALRAEKTVMNIGVIPQACAINWATTQQMELAYITGSHLSKGYNGVKFFHMSGLIYSSDEVAKVSELVRKGKYFSRIKATPVREEAQDIFDIYIRNVTGKIKSTSKKKAKILIDCGNGVNGLIAKKVFEKAGFNTDVIFDKPDGNFPNRGPDPATDKLDEMRKRIGKYSFGIAYDADGDRFFVMANDGTILTTGQILHVLLSALVGRAGDVVANIDCGKSAELVSEKFGKKVIRVPVGVANMEAAVTENRAVVGIESSHHCFVPSASEFSDAIAASMLFSKSVEDSGKPLKDIIKDVRIYPTVRKSYVCPDEKKFIVSKRVEGEISPRYGRISTVDGIRADTEKGWALVRPSKTEGLIKLTVEADDETSLKNLEGEFSRIIEAEIEKG